MPGPPPLSSSYSAFPVNFLFCLFLDRSSLPHLCLSSHRVQQEARAWRSDARGTTPGGPWGRAGRGRAASEPTAVTGAAPEAWSGRGARTAVTPR